MFKTFTRWLQNSRANLKTARSQGKRIERKIQMNLEALEARLVPTAIHTTYVLDHSQTGSHAGISPATSYPQGYTPYQLRTAYGANASNETGAGETIAIVDFYNDTKIVHDLDVFDEQFAATSSGLSLYQQFGSASSFLTVYNQNGQVINPTNTSVPKDSTGGWEGEESLDVEWAHAMAPGARIDLIECSTNLYAGVVSAANLPGVSVVSMSWSQSEFFGESSYDQCFTTPAGHIGVTFLASTGDYSQGGYPAFSPNVIAVGGTTLSLAGSDAIQNETAWSTGSDYWSKTSGTGGGTSLYESEPGYQAGFQSTGMRTIPDVSFDADPTTGVAVYDSFGGTTESSGWNQIGGTSLATPAWAGIIAMANQERNASGESTLGSSSNPTQAQSMLYGLSSGDFNDVKTGSISANGRTYYASSGYDEVTGRGSPVASSIANDLSSKPVDIAITGVSLVNAYDQPLTSVTPGEAVFIQATFTTQGLPSNASFRVSYTVDGITKETGYLNWGAGGSGTGYWYAYWGAWTATPGLNLVSVTIDPDHSVAESNFSNNSETVTFTAGSLNPASPYAYSPASGSLFGLSGPSYLDVEQGVAGDCWLIASLAEVAARDPQDIENMFTYDGTTVENGSTVGVYTVRFYNSAGTPEYVTEDTELPYGGGAYDRPVNGVLWVALAEKAYVEANAAGFVSTSYPGQDTYTAIDGGYPSWALEAITGRGSSGYSVNPNDIASAWNAGELIVLTTNSPPSSYIVGDHCYAVVGYNPSSSMPYQMMNAWGSDSLGWAPGEDNKIYGHFQASAGFVSQNFAGEYFGVGTPAAGESSSSTGTGTDPLTSHSSCVPIPNAKLRDLLTSGIKVPVNSLESHSTVSDRAKFEIVASGSNRVANAHLADVDDFGGLLTPLSVGTGNATHISI